MGRGEGWTLNRRYGAADSATAIDGIWSLLAKAWVGYGIWIPAEVAIRSQLC